MLKSISKTFLLIPVVFLLGSCWELEQEVLDGVTPEDVANSNNPALIDVLKASAYSRIVGSWGGHNSIWSIYEVSSDEMAIPQKGADWEDGGLWLSFPSSERNKITDRSILILKKQHDTDVAVDSDINCELQRRGSFDS